MNNERRDRGMEQLGLDAIGGTGVSRALGAASAADASSPESLFRAHYRTLVRSLALISGGDREAAADAVGDAFLQLEQNWDRISTYDDPAAWIRRVALNRLSNRRRSLARGAGALLRLQSQRDETPQGIQATDLALKDELGRLPLKQRTAVVLFYFADLSVAEVAEAMSVTEGAVNQHLHRARETLRKRLEVDQ
ncbi:MAG: sigma-70 family RNA polymerase sigma factor [Thermoleophilia bacterium]|nr:sigma-70 family RNA polymerase sigma factor [Thermoleophilia bacterium]